MDESWWEAVLAEEEAEAASFTAKYPSPSRQKACSDSSPHSTPQLDWIMASHLYEMDQTACLQVSGYNRGGLLVSGEGLQGFVPVSHLVEIPGEETDEAQEQWLSSYLGKMLQLKIIECDQERGRVVFSERAALAKPGSRNQLLNALRPEDCVWGVVTNITDFGVFVDLGGLEGLIHVSEISWGRVHHPTDVVSLGDEVEVYVIQVDQERARVALSLKRLYPNPWATAEERYYPGQITEAVVTSLVQFGAFARLEEGLDGLIHISEMRPGGPVATPSEVVREGQRLKVRVLHVDGSKQRLGLSLILETE